MSFTFHSYQPSKQEEYPSNNLVSNLLHGYGQGMKGKYLPQEIEADIFSKKMGPLATLATTPMFLQNPQFQAALGNMIMKTLPYGGKEFSGTASRPYGTYADQVSKDVQEAGSISDRLSKAGKAKVGASSAVGTTENYLGDVAKHIVNFFSGGAINSNLAHEENRYEDILNTLKNNSVQAGRLSSKDADQIFSGRKNETPKARLERIQKTLPSLFEQSPMDEEDQRHRDNEDISFASSLSEEIKAKTGKDVPETLIFNYMKEHPGDIYVPDLLKAIGAK